MTLSHQAPSTHVPEILNGIDVTALGQTISTFADRPDLGEARFESTSIWKGNRRVVSSVNRFTVACAGHCRPKPHEVTTDLPAALLGEDAGPAPLELALSALGACITTTLIVHAAARSIQVEALRVNIAGDLDLRGFMNLADVRAGYGGIDVEVSFDSTLSERERQEFVESALKLSPILDLFRTGTRIRTHVNSPA